MVMFMKAGGKITQLHKLLFARLLFDLPIISKTEKLKIPDRKSLTQEFFLKMFTILKIQKELIDMAKKLDTKKSHDYSSKNAQFLGEFSLRCLPKKSWHNRLKIIVAYRENRKAANHKQCITKTNMVESKRTSSLEL